MTDTGFVPLVTTLKRLLTPPVSVHPGESCELCGVPVSGDHGHIVDLCTRRLMCACAVCVNVGGRYRAVPSRYLHLPSMRLSPEQWAALAIPVDLVFFFFNSELDRVVACYPGSAGAAESLLPLEAWPALVEANPWLADLAADVEALLVRRIDDQYACCIVPIDACYALVGRIRTEWAGFGGGDRVQREIDRFFAEVARRSAAK
jgi:hypothetical protein